MIIAIAALAAAWTTALVAITVLGKSAPTVDVERILSTDEQITVAWDGFDQVREQWAAEDVSQHKIA